MSYALLAVVCPTSDVFVWRLTKLRSSQSWLYVIHGLACLSYMTDGLSRLSCGTDSLDNLWSWESGHVNRMWHMHPRIQSIFFISPSSYHFPRPYFPPVRHDVWYRSCYLRSVAIPNRLFASSYALFPASIVLMRSLSSPLFGRCWFLTPDTIRNGLLV